MKKEVQDYSSELMKGLNAYWDQFLFSLPRIAFAIIILLLILFIVSRLTNLLSRRLSGKAHDPLFVQFIVKLTKFVLIVCGIILVLHTLGFSGVAGGLLAGAGISAFVIGFAFKDIAENFLAGIILAFNRPFSLNDTVKIEEYIGHVKALNFRTTHIKTFDEKDVFIPNAKVVKETLTNMTRDGMLRIDFVVGIAYEDNIEMAIRLIEEIIIKVDGVLESKQPFVVAEELASSTVNLRVYFWTATDDYRKGVLITKSVAIAKTKEMLIEKGFTLPADIKELKLYDKRKSFPVELVGNKPHSGE